jgi:hypothetical protein
MCNNEINHRFVTCHVRLIEIILECCLKAIPLLVPRLCHWLDGSIKHKLLCGLYILTYIQTSLKNMLVTICFFRLLWQSYVHHKTSGDPSESRSTVDWGIGARFPVRARGYIYRVFVAQHYWTLTHMYHKDTEQSTIEASITFDGVTVTNSLIWWSPNESPSVCWEIPVSADKMFWTSIYIQWFFHSILDPGLLFCSGIIFHSR